MIHPYVRPQSCPELVLLRDDGRVWFERSVVELSAVPTKGVRVYADREEAMRRVIRGEGAALCWNGVPTRWEHPSGRSVILLGGYRGSGIAAYDGLLRWRTWVASHGGVIGSPTATSASLLRASLDEPLRLNGGDGVPLPEVIGGRQDGVDAGTYGAFEAWDIQAAYGRTMGELVYPGGFYKRFSGPVSDAGPLPVFSSAEVRIPNLRWAPVPRRHRKPADVQRSRRTDTRDYPVMTTVRGIWSSEELACAVEAGCRVKVRESWVHRGPERRPFARWWSWCEEGRSLGGIAGGLAKQTGNTLWSRFAMYGERTRWTYRDGRRKIVPAPLPAMPKTMVGLDLAELVTSHVRVRLYRELLAPFSNRVLSVHTDGGLLVRGEADEYAFGPDWRPKDHGRNLIYLGPQCYAYLRPRGKTTVYKVSGVPPERAPATFWSIATTSLRWPTLEAVPPEAVRELKRHFPSAIADLMARTA